LHFFLQVQIKLGSDTPRFIAFTHLTHQPFALYYGGFRFLLVFEVYIHKKHWYLNNHFIQLLWQLLFSLFSWVKNNRERKRKRENKRIMWVWERKLSKSCHKRVVQISFLIHKRKMLTCVFRAQDVLRAQDKKPKLEIKSWKMYIFNFESFKFYLFILCIYWLIPFLAF